MTDLNIKIEKILSKNGSLIKSRLTDSIEQEIIQNTPNCLGTIQERIYWIKNNISNYPKCYCGNNITKFQENKNKRYNDYCSYKCSANSEITKKRRIETVQEKYGVSNISELESIKQKRVNTNLKKYGVKNPSQADTFKEKRNETIYERFGETNVMMVPEIKEKMKQTNIERYGSEYVLHNRDIIEKRLKTNLQKYGNVNPLCNKEINEKSKKTLLNNYGVDNPSKSKEIKQKRKNTLKSRYGIEHNSQHPDFKNNLLETRRKEWLAEKLESFSEIAIPMFFINDYTTVDQAYKWKCAKCSTEYLSHIDNGLLPKCPNCNKTRSSIEDEIKEWLIENNITFKQDDRTIIKPLEIDFLLENSIAIEINGIFYHSELNGGKDRLYHLKKTELCNEKNIQLLQFFSDEWYNNKDIVKSIIKSKLNKNNKIYARKCNIQLISSHNSKSFYNKNHLQGYVNAKIHYGLYYDNELVAMMSFGKARFSNDSYELLRYASKIDTNIIGGASKLFKHFIKNFNPDVIISYADKRYSNGNLYNNLGFSYVSSSSPGYFYTKTYKERFNRIKFQKHKLKNILNDFDDDLSEWENMSNNDYDRIWDCGNLKFKWCC